MSNVADSEEGFMNKATGHKHFTILLIHCLADCQKVVAKHLVKSQ